MAVSIISLLRPLPPGIRDTMEALVGCVADVLRIAIPLTVYSIVMFFVSFFMATKLGQTTRDRIQPPHPKDSQPYLPRGSPEKPGDLQTVPNRQFAAHAPAN